MAWTVDYDAESRVIVLTFRDTSSGSDLREATSAAIALGKTHGSWRFFIDVSQGSLAVAPFTLLNLPDKHYVAEGVDRSSRLALLLPPAAKDRELARFYETACLNRDWQVQSFEDRDVARRWLLAADRRGEASANG
jgi:hypothetical protein